MGAPPLHLHYTSTHPTSFTAPGASSPEALSPSRRNGIASANTARTAPPHAPAYRRSGLAPTPPPPNLDSVYAITYIPPMRTLSSTELRANLSSVMDQVNDDHEPVIVHRAKGKPVVMVSLEDWASMDETTYLTSSPANKAALDRAIADVREGRVVVKTMEELLAYEKE